MSLLSRSTHAAIVFAAVGGLVAAVPATASASVTPDHHRHHNPFAVSQVNLVSDQPGAAALTDPSLLNSWGFGLGATAPAIAVANNHSDTATFYSSAPGSNTVTKVDGLTATFPAGTSPSGQAFNGGTGFVNTTAQGSAPAQYIYATESGQVAAYAPKVDQGNAEIRVTTPGAEYKGVAFATAKAGDQIYVVDFTQNRIDVFDSKFNRVSEPAWAFADPFIPKGFGPFHVKQIQGNLFVAYAVVNTQTGDDVAGRGNGFVDEFSPEGKFIARIATRGLLNSPWGMAIAPASWGKLAGALLIGNFGDGHITVILPNGRGGFRHEPAGQLRNATTGRPIAIDGLWGLTAGTPTVGGIDEVWFSSGPNKEADGLIGVLRQP